MAGGKPTVNSQPVAEKLQELLTRINSSTTDIKDALIATIMAILPLLFAYCG